MDGNKLELTSKPAAAPTSDLPPSYKAIPETDMEEEAVTRPKSLVKSKPASPEADGADEKMLPNEESVKVAVNEKQNGDAKLDIGDVKSAFVGLTKEELMKFANDPFWVRIRWFLFITFWILWGMMLLGAIMIILAAPKCSPPPPRTWWEKGPIAELDQPKSDSDQIKKLKELGVTGVVITWPEDAYADFDETHEIIKSLKTYKDEDINVIVELQPGYSNIWFNKSQYGDPDYSDYYIWQPAKDQSNGEPPKPPNNWVSFKNTPAWVYSDKRNEFYYAPAGLPLLNFRNPNVTQTFSDVLKKFIKFGVGGVRLKGAPSLLVDSNFNNENPVTNPGDCVLTDYCFFTHTQTENLEDLALLLYEWRIVVKNNTANGPFMVAEDISTNIEAYKLNSSYIVDLPIQSHLFYKGGNTNVTSIIHILNTTFNANNITWPLWKVNSTSEWDIITYLLPGTPLIRLDSLDNKELLKQRSSPSILRGSFNVYSLNNETVLAFIRVTAGNPGILVAYNPTDNQTVVDFPTSINAVSEEVTVLLYSQNFNETGVTINVKHKANAVPISPKSAIVLSYVPPK